MADLLRLADDRALPARRMERPVIDRPRRPTHEESEEARALFRDAPLASDDAKLVGFVAHPVGGDVVENLARARRWLHWLIHRHPTVAFCMPWLAYCEVLDDANPEHRARGLADSLSCLRGSDLMFMVGGRLSDAMRAERELAKAAGIVIIDYLFMGAEPPMRGPERTP